MKKYENYSGSLDVLCSTDRDKAENDEIYRMGMTVQFDMTLSEKIRTAEDES